MRLLRTIVMQECEVISRLKNHDHALFLDELFFRPRGVICSICILCKCGVLYEKEEIQNSSGNIAQFTNTVFLHEMNCPQLRTVLWSVISDLHLMIDRYVEYQ